MSQTATIELHEVLSRNSASKRLNAPLRRSSEHSIGQTSRRSHELRSADAPLPPQLPLIVEAELSWNSSPGTIYKVFCCFFSLLIMGLNDAAYGALLPYIEPYYGLSYTVVSLIFLFPFVGYFFASMFNNVIHNKVGQRGVAIIGGACKIVAYTVISQHPPYPALVVMYCFIGFGIGIEDAAWNAWMGAMKDANQLLGLLHGFYGLGATLSPLIATSLITKAGWPWWDFYYFMIGASVFEIAVTTSAFWDCNGAAFRASIAAASTSTENTTSGSKTGLREALLRAPAARVTWLCSVFLICYMGIEVSLGGWIVTFMRRVRDGTPFASGLTATGFWLGLTLGRVVLGFVTPKLGEKLAISIYMPLSMALQLLFWLVPSFVLSAIFAAFEGFFLGPLFPAAVVAMTKLLPKHLHVTAIGFAAAFGGCGAAIFPFVVGAVAQATSVKALQPIVLAMMVLTLSVWLALPRMRKRD